MRKKGIGSIDDIVNGIYVNYFTIVKSYAKEVNV
jgi:hypothetical protein